MSRAVGWSPLRLQHAIFVAVPTSESSRIMFNRGFAPLVLIAFVGASCWVQAEPPPTICSPAKAVQADEKVGTLDSWSAVSDYYGEYGQCDDGSIAEGSSEAVARLLMDHWDTLPALARLIDGDPPLEPFVLRHVNATLDTKDLERIRDRAASTCPEGASVLCGRLGKAASRALE